MTIIDSHQHFWKYDPVRDAWIDDSMQVIRRDFLPSDLNAIYKEHDVAGCVAVQADQSEQESEFLLSLAEIHSFIRGVVGWVDLTADHSVERIAYFASKEKCKGVRLIAQGEPLGYLQRKDVQRGISYLAEAGLTYDILVYAHQLEDAIQLVRKFPNQKFVLDHLGKPNIREEKLSTWTKDITELAQSENIYCKFSGLVTEAEWDNWTYEQLFPYIDTAFHAFGAKRMMYGSDWPVCLLAASYGEVLDIAKQYLSTLTEHEQQCVMSENAIQFYNLS